MARRSARGLTIGQLLSLTLGFLIASVVIFVFGLWVGNDLAQQRLSQERQIVRLAVATAPPAPTDALVFETPTPAATPSAVPSETAVVVPATPTRASAFVPWAATPTRPGVTPASASGWTVQVAATTDLGQALRIVQNLRANGFDAYTRRRTIAGATWYRVRVGQLPSRAAAERLAKQLRQEMKLEAAYPTEE